MRKLMTAGTALALTLAFAATAQADTNVPSLTGDWATTSPTVFKTPEGVHFGTYANGGATSGSVMYSGANGMEIKDVNDFSYTFNYRQGGTAVAGAAPYMRVFTDANGDDKYQNGVDNSIVLDPSGQSATGCGTVSPPQRENLTFGTNNATFRYNDDPCDHDVRKTWNDIVTDHGTEKIVMVLVTQGGSTGTDVSGMLKNITFNGETFDFTGAPADGANGSNGSNGANGTNGTNGVNGKDGVTTVIHDRGQLTGNTVRTIHARKIQGKKFLGARASLRGKRLNVDGRSIKVDLRGKTVGNYNVVMVAKYKTKSTGKIHTERTIRSLSIFRK